MAGNIKGICIEFRGDTTKLDKALRQINNETKKLDQQLRQVDKALKFNPNSVELWRQKQDLLNKKLQETREKADLIRETLKRVDAGEIEMSADDVDKLKRELIEAESKAKTFQSQLNKIGNANLKAASEQFKQWGSSLEQAGQKMQGLSVAAAGVVASLGLISAKAGKNADDINTMSKIYGISTGELQKYKATADLVDVSVETIAKSHTKLEKSMSSAQGGSGKMADAFKTLGVEVTNADGSLREGDAVWQETIAALGKMENETERDALAMQLMGKSAAELNPLIEDGGKTYQSVADTMAKYNLDFVDQETLDKANQFNDQLDTMKMIGTVAISQVGSQLAAYLAPALEKVVGWIGQLANWLSTLSPQLLTVIGIVAAVVASLAPVLIMVGKLATGIGSIISLANTLGVGIGSIISLANTLGVGIGALAGPIGIAIAAIAAIIAVGVLLYKNWDKIKAKAIAFKNSVVTAFNDFKTKVTTTFNSIKDAIVKPIQTAIDKVKTIIDKVKGFFPIKVGKLLSGLKLPHFKLSGKFSLNPPSIPKISVDWYKTGGIFDRPSVIGIGEAGPEAVVPLDKFWDKLESLQGDTNIVININGANKDPREIADEVKRMLIRETSRNKLAWQ